MCEQKLLKDFSILLLYSMGKKLQMVRNYVRIFFCEPFKKAHTILTDTRGAFVFLPTEKRKKTRIIINMPWQYTKK